MHEERPPFRRTWIALVVAGGALAVAGLAWVAAPPRGAAGPQDDGLEAGRVALLPEVDLVVRHELAVRDVPPAGAPNVVWIVPAAVPVDALEPYGAAWGRTPFFGLVGRQGAVFADVIAASTVPRESAVAWLTGHSAAALGLGGPGTGPRVLPDEIDTLPEILQRAGWRTYGVAAHPDLHSDTGFAQGFDLYRNPQPHGLRARARLNGRGAADVARMMLQAHAAESPDRPFFLMVSLVDAIAPHRLPPAQVRVLAEQYPGEDAPLLAAYQVVDEVAATLVDQVDAHGRELMVVVMGDPATPDLLDPASVRVPWIVSGPGVRSGHLIAGLAAQEDIPATLLDLLGLPGRLPGQSWASAIRGEVGRTSRDVAFSEHHRGGMHRASIWTSEHQCQVDLVPRATQDGFETGCHDRADGGFAPIPPDAGLMAKLKAGPRSVLH